MGQIASSPFQANKTFEMPLSRGLSVKQGRQPRFGAQLTNMLLRQTGKDVSDLNQVGQIIGALFEKVHQEGLAGVRFNHGVFEFPGTSITFALRPPQMLGIRERTAGTQLAGSFAHPNVKLRTDAYLYHAAGDDPSQGLNIVLASGEDVAPHDSVTRLINQRTLSPGQVFNFLEDAQSVSHPALESLRPYSKEWLMDRTLIDPSPSPLLPRGPSVFSTNYIPSPGQSIFTRGYFPPPR